MHFCDRRDSQQFELLEYGIPFVQINICLLADEVGVTTTDTLNLGEGVHHLLLSIDVGV